MNFPFFIARRYLFSKKSTHVINVISSISVIGVAVATMALVIVLSVFNGFHDLVASLFTSFDPQLKVVPVEGKTAPADDPILTKIRLLPQVDVATETVEDQALAIYNDHQAMVKIKGVDDNFAELSHITDIYFMRIKEKTKRFLKILEPVSIIFIAFFIGLIVISVLLPVFRLGENLNI